MSNNPLLVTLEASHNLLSRLDISGNTLLQRLDLSHNTLTMTNLTANTALTWLDISGNSALTLLDIKDNTALTFLRATDLSLTSLDINTNTALDTLYLDAADCYLTVSGYRAIDNVNTFGRVCVFNDDNGATYYLRWFAFNSWDGAKTKCEDIGMTLPTVEEAEIIASRIQDIRNTLNITVSYDDQDFWTATVDANDSDYRIYIDFQNPSFDFKTNSKPRINNYGSYSTYFFSTFIKY